MAGLFCMPVCTTLPWFRATRRCRTAKKFSSKTPLRSSWDGSWLIRRGWRWRTASGKTPAKSTPVRERWSSHSALQRIRPLPFRLQPGSICSSAIWATRTSRSLRQPQPWLSRTPPMLPSCRLKLPPLPPNNARARHWMDDVNRRRPLDTKFQTMLIPVVQAILFINHGEAAKAIEVLKAGEAYDKGTTDIHFVRGRADLLNHEPAQAAQEFQAVLTLK